MKQLLIAGIDPGTTAGYAALDLSGRLIAARAEKELTLDRLIAELNALGTVLVVATDKAKVPSFVASVATQLGAKVFSPAQDLQVSEKRALTADKAYANHHEMDALAAAVVALTKHERLFSRIRSFLDDQKQPEWFERLAELVVRHGISIKAGFDFLTMPHKQATKLVRVVEGKQLRPEDYWKLYDALVIAEQEKSLLQRQNKKLMNLAKKLQKRVAKLKQSVKPETRIIRPTGELEQAKQAIGRLRQQLEYLLVRQQRLQHVLANQNAFVIAKKMKNLCSDEYRRITRVLRIAQGDILLVDDPNSFSQRVIDQLAGLVELIVSVRTVRPKIAEKLPFVILDASAVPHTQDDYFAFLDRSALEKARQNKAVLRKLIIDYQHSRQIPG
jgi:predicted RNase H-like nuclease (RuvC/YqgF family)